MYADICIAAREEGLLRLLLSECRALGLTPVQKAAAPLPAAPLYIIDADACEILPETGNIIRYGRHLTDGSVCDGARTVTDLARPFSLARLRRLLAAGGQAQGALALLPDACAVRLGARVISLTKTEYACLSSLYEAGGEPVSRAALYRAVWGEGPVKDELINLYLHYLRKKLEGDGRRFIYAVRGRGYLLKREEDLL